MVFVNPPHQSALGKIDGNAEAPANGHDKGAPAAGKKEMAAVPMIAADGILPEIGLRRCRHPHAALAESDVRRLVVPFKVAQSLQKH